MQKFEHIPVLKNETIELLNVREGKIYVDGTLGGAGHSKAILEKANIKQLIGIDQDEIALLAAKENLKDFENVFFVHENFRNIDKILNDLNIQKVDGILVDIGVSSHQIDEADRGFSFRYDAKLDMRMDKSNRFSAYELVNEYSEDELTKVTSVSAGGMYVFEQGGYVMNNTVSSSALQCSPRLLHCCSHLQGYC